MGRAKTLVVSEAEQNFASALRKAAEKRMDDIGDVEKIAEILGTHPIGVRALRAYRTWTVEMAFRVAEALELEVLTALDGFVRSSTGISDEVAV